MESKQKILSITKKDFEWDCVRGSGKGGQKKNKTCSAVRCRHLPSGAMTWCEETRSQIQNKRKAFLKMMEHPKFKKWLRVQIAKATGEFVTLEEEVDKAMSEENLKIETGKHFNA